MNHAPPAASPHHRQISADHVQLCLVARKLRPASRWAAMSNGADTAPCRQRQAGTGYLINHPPMLTPMMAGGMQRLLERVRGQGRAEVLRTWRTGINLLKTEFSSCVLRNGDAP